MKPATSVILVNEKVATLLTKTKTREKLKSKSNEKVKTEMKKY